MESDDLNVTLEKASHSKRNVGPQETVKKIIKLFQTTPTVLFNLNTTVPQNDVDI